MKYILTIPLIILLAFSSFSQTKKLLKHQLKLQKKFIKEYPFVYIPSGTYSMGYSTESGDQPNQTRVQMMTIDPFYMMQCEVSNLDYMSYVLSMDSEDTTLVKSLLPDTLCWRGKGGWNEPFAEYYLRHPAYQNYPVVGVSYNQAVAYAEWMTEQYNARPDEEKSFQKVKFRLPSEAEWELAARGGLEITSFPWGGPYMRNAEGQRLANMLYISQASVYRDTVWVRNYAAISDSTQPAYKPTVRILSSGYSDNMGVAGSLNDVSSVTAPVKSYYPNGYGLYNMTGNVEEMVDAWYQRSDSLYFFSHDITEIKAEDPSGVTRGGSWRDTGYYGMVTTRQFYEGKDSGSAERGFRLVMEVVEY